MNPKYSVALGFYLACLTIHTSYEIVKKTGKINPKNRTYLQLILLAMCLLWIGWLSMRLHDSLQLKKTRRPTYPGFVLLILGRAIYNNAAASLFDGFVGVGNILIKIIRQKLTEKNILDTASIYGFKIMFDKGGYSCFIHGW
jgi:hypothetical protein